MGWCSHTALTHPTTRCLTKTKSRETWCYAGTHPDLKEKRPGFVFADEIKMVGYAFAHCLQANPFNQVYTHHGEVVSNRFNPPYKYNLIPRRNPNPVKPGVMPARILT